MGRGGRGGHHDVGWYLFFAVHQLHGVWTLASGFALFSCHSFSFFSSLVAFCLLGLFFVWFLLFSLFLSGPAAVHRGEALFS